MQWSVSTLRWKSNVYQSYSPVVASINIKIIPQCSSAPFAAFACEWEFQLTTSSPLHSNGKVESTVKISKTLLKKAKKFVRIDDVRSKTRFLKGSIPQGTKLGPILFSIMVNDLVTIWPNRAKYVDVLTLLEVVPRN